MAVSWQFFNFNKAVISTFVAFYDCPVNGKIFPSTDMQW
jgi:hypothetical protein